MRTAVFLMVLGGLLLPGLAQAAVEVAPYGFVLVNASYNTRSLTDVPWVAPGPGAGEPSFDLFARQTRIGFKMKSDATYTPSGAIEVDFYGLRGSGGNGGPTQVAPRLRRAFMEIHMKSFDLLAGQEWIAFSPLNPTTLMHASLPGMMGSGNLWARLPQVRATMRPVSDESSEVKLDLALTRPLGADAEMTPVTQADALGRGERYGWPWVQGRLGFASKGATKVTVGAGGHYGMEDFGDDPAGDDLTGASMAVAGDLQIAAGKATFSGEGFWGQNINTLFSNAKFALVPDSLKVDDVYRTYTNVEEITVVGGWGELKVAASPKLDIAVNGGLEQLDDEFLATGALKSNTTFMGALIAKPTPGVQIGLEGGYIMTKFKGNDPGTADAEDEYDRNNLNVNLSFMYSF